MTRSLAATPFNPVPCAQPIQSMFSISSGPQFVALFLGAGFTTPLTALVLAQSLASAGFNADQAVAGLDTAGAEINAAVSALASVGYQASDVAPALLRSARYRGSVATAQSMSAVLVRNYPSLSLSQLFWALANSAFRAYQAVGAAMTYLRPDSAVTTVKALAPVYPNLTPLELATALGNGSFGQSDLATAFRLIYAAIQLETLDTLAGAVAIAGFPALVNMAEQDRAQGASLQQAAQHLQNSSPSLSIYALSALLDAVYQPDLRELAFPVTAVSPNYYTLHGQLALLLGFTNTAPADLASIYLQALEASKHTALPAGLAGGLAGSYAAIGTPLSPTIILQAIAAAYASVGSQLKMTDAARAMSALGIDMVTCAQAMVATFTSALIAPAQCASAMATGYGRSRIQPADTAQAIIQVFDLSRCPVDVGAVCLALYEAGFDVVAVSQALPSLMSNWTADSVQTLKQVFANPTWNAAYLQWIQWGRDTGDVAVMLQRAYGIGPAELVEVLVGSCYLTRPDTAATPLAIGLKAVELPYDRALLLLQVFFAGLWTAYASDQVWKVYFGTGE